MRPPMMVDFDEPERSRVRALEDRRERCVRCERELRRSRSGEDSFADSDEPPLFLMLMIGIALALRRRAG